MAKQYKYNFPTLLLVLLTLAFLTISAGLLLSRRNISLQPKARTCTSNECSTSSGCQLSGYVLNLNGVDYTCVGNNEWRDPQGNLVAGDANGPVVTALVEAPAEEQPVDDPANYVPVNYEEELQSRAQEGDSSVIAIEQCNAVFWNVKPPPIPVEEAASQANAALLDVQQRVENGEDFKTACKDKAGEMNADRPTYDQATKDYYEGEYSIGMNFRLFYSSDEQPAYTPKNGSLNEEIKKMAAGELRIFDQIDGGYIDDDITENDEDYHAGYFLVRKVQ